MYQRHPHNLVRVELACDCFDLLFAKFRLEPHLVVPNATLPMPNHDHKLLH